MTEKIKNWFTNKKLSFLVTGAAGFVGTNLVLRLLELGQSVTVVDSFITGRASNIEYINNFAKENGKTGFFKFIKGDLNAPELCKNVAENIDYVFHEAAIASVPWSLKEPHLFHSNNDAAFFNILNASRLSGVKRFIYASSSAVYGANSNIPSVEDNIGEPLSVYGAAKLTNEIYAKAFFNSFGFESIGFRYFNIYGKFQDPYSAYAAVIPIWVKKILSNERFIINGDGTTTRDFCYVDDIIDINLLAVMYGGEKKADVYNAGSGKSVSLNELVQVLKGFFGNDIQYEHGPFRDGDIKYSQADITKAERELGFNPKFSLKEGLEQTLEYYMGLFK
ncbi:MAG: NAD-dependent epimerase/dehydratase family protein [Deltaproteobacteria bacterium]|nr:NAD-dependent epimerase/dehydratase family protein [Deltaproteobacteria bacterium]MCL5880678.1 NAD-dependent epimerase/dehydratase family protein [Deltaproteobacteria bacterium]